MKNHPDVRDHDRRHRPLSAFRQLAQGDLLGVPTPILVVVLLYAMGTLVLYRTSFGPTVLAIGGQQDAAVLMGLPVVRTTVVTYTMSGLLAGFAGVMIASYTPSGVTVIGVGAPRDSRPRPRPLGLGAETTRDRAGQHEHRVTF